MLAGAFGAHGLQKRPGVTPENLRAWGSAAQYAVRLISILQRRHSEAFGSVQVAGGVFRTCGASRRRDIGNASYWCAAAVLPNTQTVVTAARLLTRERSLTTGVQRARIAVDLHASALRHS